jgi:hypothetical protein
VKSLVPAWAGALSAGAVLGMLPFMYAMFKKEEKPMSPLEKAFNALVVLLCQEVTKKDEQLEALHRELRDRPTREQLRATERRELLKGDEVNDLRSKLEAVTKERDELRLKKRFPRTP